MKLNAYVAILAVGAYDVIMSRNDNARSVTAEVWADDGSWPVIRTRQPGRALCVSECLPE